MYVCMMYVCAARHIMLHASDFVHVCMHKCAVGPHTLPLSPCGASSQFAKTHRRSANKPGNEGGEAAGSGDDGAAGSDGGSPRSDSGEAQGDTSPGRRSRTSSGNIVGKLGRPGDPPPTWQGRPGDWQCPSCNYTVFANKTHCPKCVAAKPGEHNAYVQHCTDAVFYPSIAAPSRFGHWHLQWCVPWEQSSCACVPARINAPRCLCAACVWSCLMETRAHASAERMVYNRAPLPGVNHVARSQLSTLTRHLFGMSIAQGCRTMMGASCGQETGAALTARTTCSRASPYAPSARPLGLRLPSDTRAVRAASATSTTARTTGPS